MSEVKVPNQNLVRNALRMVGFKVSELESLNGSMNRANAMLARDFRTKIGALRKSVEELESLYEGIEPLDTSGEDAAKGSGAPTIAGDAGKAGATGNTGDPEPKDSDGATGEGEKSDGSENKQEDSTDEQSQAKTSETATQGTSATGDSSTTTTKPTGSIADKFKK